MSIDDYLKNCVYRKNGQMVYWDDDDNSFVLLKIKDVEKTLISHKDLTASEIAELMKKTKH